MRITGIETEEISIALSEEAFDSTARWSEFNLLLVEVKTDEGVSGISDIAPLHGREMGVFREIIERILKPKLIGENPFKIERIWRNCIGYGSSAYALGRAGAVVTATSAIDIALWDILAKSLKTPLYSLLGGEFREEVTLYASFMGQPEVGRVEEVLKNGFEAVKLKVGFDVQKDLEYLRLLREELGNEFRIMVDGNQGYDFEDAVRFAREAEELSIEWFEEPIDVYNFRALKELSRRIEIPVALGENYYMMGEFLEAIESGARFIQPDFNHSGGITQIRKIASLSEFHSVKLAPHLHSPVGFLSGLHILLSSPSGYIAEYPVYGEEWDRIFRKYVEIEKSKARVIRRDGIGFEPEELIAISS
ncbi:MAG: D-galactarolactone cycloisomerase [Archaeoglobi archaeon]|nr:D-galactarolactone cycloisomerase [Archaeoglobi archaeon]MDK2782048.1 D-galactarolactone cycloisomerase [Archaeoglobi archaeon]